METPNEIRDRRYEIRQEKYFSSLFLLSLISYLLFPSVSFAAFEGVSSLLGAVGHIISLLIPIAYGAAILFFFYGVGKYILAAGNEKSAKEGKSIMIYGVIAIFVMSSIWGIIQLVGNNLGIQTPVQGSSPNNGCALGDQNCGDGSGNGN